MAIRRFLLLVGIATLVCLISACATSRMAIKGDFADPSNLGLVVFYTGSQEDGSEEELRLDISLLIDDQEVRRYRNYDAWSSIADFRIACAPGQYDFLVSHRNFRERVRVQVDAGRLSFVSLRKQYLSETSSGNYNTGITTTSVYLVSCAIATETVPLSWDEESLVTALNNRNWGIRHYALRSLRQFKEPLGEDTLSLVSSLAHGDPLGSVRYYAKAALKARNQALPREPLFLEGFESNLRGYWPLLDAAQAGVGTWFADSGYTVKVIAESERWIAPAFSWMALRRDKLVFQLDCAHVEGMADALYGICVAETDQNALLFGISKDGGASVWLFRDGKWQALLPWTNQAAASIRSSEYSRLTVRKAGNSYEFAVNGQTLGSVTAELVPQKLGLAVRGSQTINFDRLLAD